MKTKMRLMRTNEEGEGSFVWDELTEEWHQTAGTCQVNVPADKARALRYLRSQFGSCRNLRPRTGGTGGWLWEIKSKTYAELAEDAQKSVDRAAVRAAARADVRAAAGAAVLAAYYVRQAQISAPGVEAEKT